jgi:lipopolysaccharide/colanic/teichoic acid biosynthesis glycosyltransferase
MERLGALSVSIKRGVDILAAGLGLVLLAPVLVVIGLWIRTTSSGPALFRQWRRGRAGKPFQILKFRTMAVNAEDRLSELSASGMKGGFLNEPDDPRVTRLGKLLRATSLDELPQLINVLRGEMSLVGPRPLVERDCDALQRSAPRHFARRLAVRPGMTGLAQISGRNHLDPLRALELDVAYIESWNLGLDLAILARTPMTVISGHGAY